MIYPLVLELTAPDAPVWVPVARMVSGGQVRQETAGVAQQPQGLVGRMEHHHVAVYLVAMVAGGLLGWALPAAGPGWSTPSTRCWARCCM
jgi:hypothetical protein